MNSRRLNARLRGAFLAKMSLKTAGSTALALVARPDCMTKGVQPSRTAAPAQAAIGDGAISGLTGRGHIVPISYETGVQRSATLTGQLPEAMNRE
jgi:hypothetical protein